MSRRFALHIVSWYAGVAADEVAAAERCTPAAVRGARLSLRRGPEYGYRWGTPDFRPTSPQLTLAQFDVLMRTNRGVC
ncbi:MAG: hypothetical protein QOG35_1614 [Solirubrobacteraceae bacterium]|nr:hypothetical protein [Solirubrobacteraceae bacterium]